MSNASTDPASAPASLQTVRLRRGWIIAHGGANGITFSRRQPRDGRRIHSARAWFLARGEHFLCAFFERDVASSVRDAVNRCGALLAVDNLLARCCEEHPSLVEVGFFRGDEFEHLVQLERPLAHTLLFSLLQSLEKSLEQSTPASQGGPIMRRVERARLSRACWQLLLWELGECMLQEVLVDCLEEARHYCDAHDLDFAALDRAAYSQYLTTLGARHDCTENSIPCCLNIPRAAWKDISEPQDGSVLASTVLIDGVSHHLKATQVETRDSVQCAVDSQSEDELAQMHAACGACGPFQTVSIEGRRYVVTMTPFSH
jgi:hypothetical protein